jgi:hypothetical protein
MSQQSPLVSSSTITFFASWRGQLLICTVVLIVGGVYFLLQEPIASYRRARKEVLSKVREKELMSMTTTEDKEAVEENKDKEKRGRDKRKDPRKRKGSLLKVPTSAGISGESSPAPSSMESSPAPTQKPTLPSIPKLPQSDKSASHSVAALPLSPPTRPAHDATPKKSKATAVKTPISYPVELPENSILPPYTIPLPETPGAGPSRIILPPVDNDSGSQDGEAGTTSESAPDPLAKDDKSRNLSDGFSIIPEEGYLPASIADLSGKKKKRKNKVPPPALPKLNGSSSVVDTAKSETDIVGPLKSPPPTPSTSRHARKASLTRPIGVNLEDLLSEREKMIDTLRAEIGAAKAEEAKAREEASRGKHTEERLSRDVERMRKANAKSESESRRREIEVSREVRSIGWSRLTCFLVAHVEIEPNDIELHHSNPSPRCFGEHAARSRQAASSTIVTRYAWDEWNGNADPSRAGHAISSPSTLSIWQWTRVWTLAPISQWTWVCPISQSWNVPLSIANATSTFFHNPNTFTLSTLIHRRSERLWR